MPKGGEGELANTDKSCKAGGTSCRRSGRAGSKGMVGEMREGKKVAKRSQPPQKSSEAEDHHQKGKRKKNFHRVQDTGRAKRTTSGGEGEKKTCRWRQ